MPILEISVVPVGTTSSSFSSAVADAVRLIEQRGLRYQVTPTATVIEGDLEQLMDAAKAIHQNALANGVQRVITHINIDDRTDKPMRMDQQVETVRESLH
jgi:uncharacterized protein (TIGR00106 family)